MMADEVCPCGSGRVFQACCAPLLDGGPATEVVALMRSRYTAYVRGDTAHLLRSWHASTRPAAISRDGVEWLRLEILAAGDGPDASAWVEFRAWFREAGGRIRALRERSRFLNSPQGWRYVDGDVRLEKPQRNGPCPCGSGRKFKRCCGAKP